MLLNCIRWNNRGPRFEIYIFIRLVPVKFKLPSNFGSKSPVWASDVDRVKFLKNALVGYLSDILPDIYNAGKSYSIQ